MDLMMEQKSFEMWPINIYPLVFYIVMILMRVNIISTRHGTTPPRIYREMFDKPITKELLNENIMLRAWGRIPPCNVAKEVTKTMLKAEINQDFFTFKTFLPVYPPLKKYLLEDFARDKDDESTKWEFHAHCKEEKKIDY